MGPNGYSCVVEDVKMHCSFLGEKSLPILLCNVHLDNFINFSFASLAEKSRVTWICLATGNLFMCTSGLFISFDQPISFMWCHNSPYIFRLGFFLLRSLVTNPVIFRNVFTQDSYV